MQKRIFILFSLIVLCSAPTCMAQQSHLQKQGTATQLVVDGKPFLILGGELGNSSASSEIDIDRNFPKLQRMQLNTVLVPVYWDLLEPTEGKFDFTLVDKVVNTARENQLKVVFLWFGVWKNSMSCYAPLWFKENYKKYPRAHTQAGKPLEIASAFSKNVYEADSRAFSELMRHIASIDKNYGTVIMVQIENEIGMLEDARDYSLEANAEFQAQVPTKFMNYLQKHKDILCPQMLEKWNKNGCKTKGNWQQIFGNDIYTDEIFMAWHYAQYVEKLAREARSIYDIPLYVNAAMNSRNRKPGEYPSAGPLAHLIDVWHCAAPSIDLLAPDLYDNGFVDWVKQYALPDNPLFIPEIKFDNNVGVRAFYVFGEHNALGFSPFSVEDGSDSPQSLLVKSYSTLKELMPVITKYQGTDAMHGFLFDYENRETIFAFDDIKITCRHYFTLPWDARAKDKNNWSEGGGIIIKLSANEYIVAGSGIVAEFEKADEEDAANGTLGEDGFVNEGGNAYTKNVWMGTSRIGIGSVDQISVVADGTFKYIRRLNGDQDHQGRHVRISVDDFQILHVKLYEYK